MKTAVVLLMIVLAAVAFAVEPDSKIPPLIGKLPMESDGPTQFGVRKHGVRIGFTKPKASYRLNHRINIWIAYDMDDPKAKEETPKAFPFGIDIVTLTHPDGSVSTFSGDNHIDGPPSGTCSWAGGLSDYLHEMVRKPGVYKIQWKYGDLESQVISFRIIEK